MKKPRPKSRASEDIAEPNQDGAPDSQIIRADFGIPQLSGPFPSPALLREFDQLVTGGAERIFRQFEVEASHRRALESSRMRSEASDRRTAQYVAVGFACAVLLLSALALYLGAHSTASVIGGGAVLLVIASFLGTKLLDRAEEEPD